MWLSGHQHLVSLVQILLNVADNGCDTVVINIECHYFKSLLMSFMKYFDTHRHILHLFSSNH